MAGLARPLSVPECPGEVHCQRGELARCGRGAGGRGADGDEHKSRQEMLGVVCVSGRLLSTSFTAFAPINIDHHNCATSTGDGHLTWAHSVRPPGAWISTLPCEGAVSSMNLEFVVALGHFEATREVAGLRETDRRGALHGHGAVQYRKPSVCCPFAIAARP